MRRIILVSKGIAAIPIAIVDVKFLEKSYQIAFV